VHMPSSSSHAVIGTVLLLSIFLHVLAHSCNYAASPVATLQVYDQPARWITGFVLVAVLLPIFAGATARVRESGRVRGKIHKEADSTGGPGSDSGASSTASAAASYATAGWMQASGTSGDARGGEGTRVGEGTPFRTVSHHPLTMALMLGLLLAHARHFW
jgi:hypothetical protein